MWRAKMLIARAQSSRVIVCYWKLLGGARDVMLIVVGIGHGDTSANPGRD